MKNSDLKAYIKESIINTLSENYIGDEPLDALLKMGTADMNLWHVTKLIDAGILKDSDYKKALKALDPSRPLEEADDDQDDKDAIRGAKKAGGKFKKLDLAVKDLKDLETEMRSMARKYSEADGIEKEKIKNELKDKTSEKRELESYISKLEKDAI